MKTITCGRFGYLHLILISVCYCVVLLGLGDPRAALAEGAEMPVVEINSPLPTFDLFDQVYIERRSLRIANLPQLQEQKKQIEEMYRADWVGKTGDGRATLENAAKMSVYLGASLAVLDDPARPKVMWALPPAHRWYGIDWPGSNGIIENPDNLYRWILIDGVSRYEITGQRVGAGPAQQSFILYDSVPGTKVQTLEGAMVISALRSDEIKYEPDGSFRITIGPEKAPEGTNHLYSGPDAKIIFIRDTMNDWTTQYPVRVSIRRMDGPPSAPPKSDAELAETAVWYAKKMSAYWLEYFQRMNYDNPPNTIPALAGRIGKWGYVSTNWFKLEEDEAWVMTLDPISAEYFGFQIADPWGITPDYIFRTSSLSAAQAKPSPDGTYTFVLGPKDPGVWNWIDTAGMRMGLFTTRWQGITDESASPDNAVVTLKVVKLDDLDKMLPPDIARVTPAERNEQRADRAASFALRLLN